MGHDYRKTTHYDRDHRSSVTALVVTPNGRKIVSASRKLTSTSWKNPVKVWDVTTGEQLITLNHYSKEVTAVLVTPDGEKVISGSWDKTIKMWNINNGELIKNFTGDSSIGCCAITPDGSNIIAGEASGQLHFLQLTNY